MLKNMLVFVSVVGMFWSCDVKTKELALQSTVDSLRAELETNHKTAQTLLEIGTLIDSIDAGRHVLKTRMVEGTSFDDYSSRMLDISKYVKETHQKIAMLENKLSSSKNSSSSFTGVIKKLKGDLAARDKELIAMRDQVARFRNENDNLVHVVSMQQAEIDDNLQKIKIKQDEIATLEANVSDLMVKSKVDEADAYFARAQAIEQVADRTHFAPRKKKSTRMETIELYKMAAAHGKTEAEAKITELEKKI